MHTSAAKVRFGFAGLHYFNRDTGLNILFDDLPIPDGFCHNAPRQVSIALTNTCDLSCPYCFAPKFHAVLEYNRLIQWLRELDEHGTLGVGFGGGEPTLYPRFVDLCEFATRETRLAVTFTSHGHYLKPDLLKRLSGHVNFIRLSMDGVGVTYELLRGRSFVDFTTRVRDVHLVAPFGINFVVNDETVNDLEAAMDFAHREGASEFLLIPEHSGGRRPPPSLETRERLLTWVQSYRGNVRLSVSEAGSDGMNVCDPCAAESGLRAYAHISAAGTLQRTSYESAGVAIGDSGIIDALSTILNLQKSTIS